MPLPHVDKFFKKVEKLLSGFSLNFLFMSSISIDCLFRMDEIIDINAAMAPVIRKRAARTVNG